MRHKIPERARILIIDDQPMAAEVLCSILENEGVRHVVAINDPRTSLKQFEEFKPDLIVLDWMMPQMPGLHVLRQLRRVTPRDTPVPILVVTAAVDTETTKEALANGATDFVVKPYDPAEIVLRVGNLLETRFLHLELKQKHDAVLYRERQFLSVLVDHVADGIVACDADGVPTLLNRAMRELHGLPATTSLPDKWEPRYFRDIDDHPLGEEAAPLHRALSGERLHDVEMTIMPLAGGKLREVRVHGKPLFSPEGERLGAMVVVHDSTEKNEAQRALRHAYDHLDQRVRDRTAELAVTNEQLRREIAERRQIEAALRESEARKAAVLEAALDAIITMDAAGLIVELNPAAAKMLGLEGDAAIGRELAELIIPPEYREMHRRGLARYIATGESTIMGRRIEIIAQRPDGARFPVELEVTRIANDGPVLFTGHIRDVTSRKEGEAALRDSESKFRAIFESTPAVVFIKDRQSRFVMVNNRFTELLGVSEEQAIGRTNIDGLPPDRAAVIEQNDQAVFSSAEAMEFEETVETADGPRIFLSSKVPLLDADGKVYALCGIATDITERKRAEAAVLEAKQEAESANAAKNQFLSRMSHELRTPLNAILGFTELFEMKGRSPEERENIEQIQNAGRRLLQLINEVLDVARIDVDGIPLSIEAVPLSVMLGTALALSQPAATAHGVELIPTACELEVFADQQRLEQVLLNLVSNGIKYNRVGGSVAFACRMIGDATVRLEVRDTGMGIAAEEIEKVFQPFERLGNARGPIAGIGLGLTISKRLVTLMGGAIGVESTVGSGSTFWIDLPSAPADTGAPEKRKARKTSAVRTSGTR